MALHYGAPYKRIKEFLYTAATDRGRLAAQAAALATEDMNYSSMRKQCDHQRLEAEAASLFSLAEQLKAHRPQDRPDK